MPNPDLVQLYFPTLAEIPEAAVLDCRARLDTYLRRGWPELDTRPASPFGDLQLTPFAYMVTAAEIAMGRFMSDLDLANVASGVIWNCDFVTRYLKNFAVTPQTTAQASGTVRITFNADREFVLDRRTQFSFGAENILTLRLPEDGAFIVRPVGAALPAGANSRNLFELGSGLYGVDVPVVGVMTSQVTAGDAATTDTLVAGTQTITALTTFDPGLPPESLPTLARKTRDTFYSATPNSRGGVARFIAREFPEVTGVSAVLSGDAEMVRDSANALGITDGRLDVYVRSTQSVIQTQLVRLRLATEVVGGSPGGDFVGVLALAGIPHKIDSIVAVGAPNLDLSSAYTIYSRSLDHTRATMAQVAYSTLEELGIVLPMPLEEDPVIPRIPTDIVDGVQSAVFAITYRTDPLLLTVSETMGSREFAPVGVDVLVKGLIPVVISSLTVNYTRRRGSKVRVDVAAAEILTYFRSLTSPQPYADSRIVDAMLYAGAEDVLAVSCVARLQWSVASKFLPAGAPALVGGFVAAAAAALTPLAVTMASARGFAPAYRDARRVSDPEHATWEAVGARNICFILDEDDLHFQETAL